MITYVVELYISDMQSKPSRVITINISTVDSSKRLLLIKYVDDITLSVPLDGNTNDSSALNADRFCKRASKWVFTADYPPFTDVIRKQDMKPWNQITSDIATSAWPATDAEKPEVTQPRTQLPITSQNRTLVNKWMPSISVTLIWLYFFIIFNYC